MSDLLGDICLVVGAFFFGYGIGIRPTLRDRKMLKQNQLALAEIRLREANGSGELDECFKELHQIIDAWEPNE